MKIYECRPIERLPQQAVELLVEWIRRGAPDPRVNVPQSDRKITGDPNDWWSLRPLVGPNVPKRYADLHPIDAFVQQQVGCERIAAGIPGRSSDADPTGHV